MMCSNCGKREVDVLIKQVINQEVHNLNLCRVCAEELGFISSDTPSITISFSLSDMGTPSQKKTRRLAGKALKEQRYDLLKCESCGLGYKEFRQSGLLGCPDCYEAFRFPLGAFLQKEQGAESHWGGTSGMFSSIETLEGRIVPVAEPNYASEVDSNIERLRSEMDDAVSREEYERAAEIRDRLMSMSSCKCENENDE